MSHPFFGQRFTFVQPDGTPLEVRGWGDQRRAVFETLDGYTVTKNPKSGFYEYAEVAADGQSLRSIGVAPGGADVALAMRPHLRLAPEVARARAELGTGLPKARWEERRERFRAARLALAGAGILAAPPARRTVGDYVALCLLVDFPDEPATISRQDVEDFCNQRGYTGFGNNGSVHDFFLDSSAGSLRYTTIVAPYYTAREERPYYTDPDIAYGERARELIREALAHHLANGFDFSGLSTDDGGYVFATNVFYAGSRVNDWAEGLWPHASRLLTPYSLAPGCSAFDYQITDMSHALALGTYCHENGHMLCDFPDLYDYGPESSGVGSFCLMCAGGTADPRNPAQICGYLKYRAGWATMVAQAASAGSLTLDASANAFVIHRRDPFEYFLIENRHQAGRDAALPDSGLAIWHVDELGDNSNEQGTASYHYECSLVQADGRYDLEAGIGQGDGDDLFHAGWRDRFADDTAPASQWWDGSSSGLEVRDVGAPGPRISLSVRA
jgi:M6 family metalloprotease-like protein